ncbi:EamA family transporter [Mergibacter septicus]|uniref:DMT family transporter n=1 Tax=Mergibacter septicus TaxID=221402 RepID=UPI001178D300|nr:DMT family transporter [Mergibacter septicus]AWX13894.1 EamA family transporter [Mergibacter septicus]
MKHTYRPVSGFFLALSTALCWGSLPFALQEVLKVMDSQTIVWFRFMVAAIGLMILLRISGKLPPIRLMLKSRFLIWLIIGTLGLSANFILFNTSLEYIKPSVSQIIGQISPFIMMLSGVVIFKEKLGLHQKIGIGLLITGLLLFFNSRLLELFTSMTSYTKGVLLCLSAAILWVLYGLAQKFMLRRFNSQQILFVFYIGCAVIFTPSSHVSQIQHLNWFYGFCLAYCCLNTLIAYGAYAEALNRWDISKVSAIITLTPLFTITFSEILSLLYPQRFSGPDMNTLAYIGAFIVVTGALTSAIGHKFYRSTP